MRAARAHSPRDEFEESCGHIRMFRAVAAAILLISIPLFVSCVAAPVVAPPVYLQYEQETHAYLLRLQERLLRGGGFASCGWLLPVVKAVPAASVNLVALPYSYAYREQHPDQRKAYIFSTGGRMPYRFQEDLLFSDVRQPVGFTLYQGINCDPQIVMNALLENDNEGGIQRNNGLTVVGGSIFEKDEIIYVETQIAFARKGRRETARASFPSSMPNSQGDEKEIRFEVPIPAQVVRFPPQVLTATALDQITADAELPLFHKFPSESSMVATTDLEAGRGVQVQIVRTVVRGETQWDQVMLASADPVGPSEGTFWIQRPQWSIRTVLPELHFMDVVRGYLSYQTLEDNSDGLNSTEDERRQIIEQVEASADLFQTFSADSSTGGFSEASAVAYSLVGTLFLLEQGRSKSAFDRQDALRKAHDYMSRAVQAAPYLSQTHSLQALASIALCCEERTLDEVQQGLINAITINTQDSETLLNYEKFLGYVRDNHPDFLNMPPDDVEELILFVQNLRTNIAPSSESYVLVDEAPGGPWPRPKQSR